MRVAVIGAGSWGSAVSKVLFLAGHEVRVWARREVVARHLREGENPYYLPGVSLPKLQATTSLGEAIEGAEMVVYAVPAQHMREVLTRAYEFIDDGMIHVNLAKGMEMGTFKRMEEVFLDVLGRVEYSTLSGPSHAEEVARDVPTSVVVASRDEDIARKVQEAFSTVSFRVYTTGDVTGVELAGTLKNIIAIAAGVVDGIGGWDNTKAALITRGLAEISRFGVFFGARMETFMGLAGVGDLMVTCTSRHSRNRYVGEMLARGKTLDEILSDMNMVAEGVYNSKVVWELSKEHGIDMPITGAVYSVLYEGLGVKDAIHMLMRRPLKREM